MSTDEATTTDTEAFSNPRLDVIADRVAREVRLAMERAVLSAVEPDALPSDSTSLEHVFLRQIEELPVEQQQAAQEAFLPLARGSSEERLAAYGELAAIDLRSFKTVGEQASEFAIPDARSARLSEEDLIDIEAALVPTAFAGRDPAVAELLNGEPPPDGLIPQDLELIELFLSKLHCDRVTQGLGLADDPIWVAGVQFDSSAVTWNTATKKVELTGTGESFLWKVGTFGGGDDHSGGPLGIFHPHGGRNEWPKSYAVTWFFIAHRYGGLSEGAASVVDYVRDKAVEYFTVAAGGAGAAVGGPLGAIIGAALGFLIGKAIAGLAVWFKAMFDDLYFPPVTDTTTVLYPGYQFSISSPSTDPSGLTAPNQSATPLEEKILRKEWGFYRAQTSWFAKWFIFAGFVPNPKLLPKPADPWRSAGYAANLTALALKDSLLFAATRDGQLSLRDAIPSGGSPSIWRPIDWAPDPVAMAALAGRLYAVTSGGLLLVRDAVTTKSDWSFIGAAPGVIALAASDDSLYALGSGGQLLERPPEPAGGWTPIGNAPGLLALAASWFRAGWALYGATSANTFVFRGIKGPASPWLPSGPLPGVTVMAGGIFTGHAGAVFAAAPTGKLMRLDTTHLT